MASFFKRFKRAALMSFGVPSHAAKKLAGIGGKPLPPGAKPEDYQGELDSELNKYSHVNENASKGVLDDSKAAGTYADTPAANIQRQGEADAEARYGHRASLERINSLQTSLGIPVTPASQLPSVPTTPGTPTADPAGGTLPPAQPPTQPPAAAPVDPNAPPAPAAPKQMAPLTPMTR